MKKTFEYKKLDEDDILEILLEYFQETVFKDADVTRGLILGKPGKDLRFIGVFGVENDNILQCELQKIEKQVEFNGDHSFLKNNPKFQL